MTVRPRRRVVVVGGGLTGLVVAWRLRESADVVLLEADDRLGGAVRTVTFDGAQVDMGADAMLLREPACPRLLDDVGIGDHERISPATGRVLLWRGRRLRPLPEATAMGVPTRLTALVRSRAVSVRGLLRAGSEPLRRVPPPQDDVSVAELVGTRFGPEVVDGLVEPLLGGVYAGRADRLSARATVPGVWAAATEGGSMLRALARRRREAMAVSGPVFTTLRSGLGGLVDRLATDLGDRVVTGATVTGLRRADDRVDGRWQVVTATGRAWSADDVVLCVPAPVIARVLGDIGAATSVLDTISYASVAVVALAYDRDRGDLPSASGILVPAASGSLVKAVTFTSRKWPHHAGHRRWLLRASVGRVDDRRHDELDDETLARRVDREVRTMTGLDAPAAQARVVRWPDAVAQYEVGHLDRVTGLRESLARQAPGIHLGGAAFDGIGLAARCAQAERLVAAIMGTGAPCERGTGAPD